MTEQLQIPFPITKDQICLMCHWSSGCNKCCNRCKDRCNAMQKCGLDDSQEHLISRWQSIYGIINDFKDYENRKTL